MIENVEVVAGGKYKVEEDFKKYARKRIGKLGKFLPMRMRKGATAKVVVREVNRSHGNKYELSVALDVPGGRVMSAHDEAGNIFAGVDILEAKLAGQIRRFKLEATPHQQGTKRRIWRKIFRRG